MHELFEFVRLLSVRTNRSHHQDKTEIIRFAWKEEGEISFLALLCSNDHLLLRYDITGRSPSIKQLPWLPDKNIASMCFDPTLTWLLIATETSQEIFIIPALSIVDPEAVVNRTFKTDDVTLRNFSLTAGNVSCVLWWQTLEGKQIAIVATNVGEIVFVNLLEEEGGETKSMTIDVTIIDLSLSQDDLQMNTTLLITTVTGNQWRLLLETRTTLTSFSPDSDINELGYDNIDGRSIPPRTILDSASENDILFTPTQFLNFQPPTLLKPQYARGRHFITAHCTVSSTLLVLDSDAEHSPLFVYKLPSGADNIILTDKLIFSIINHSRDKKLMVLSNQKSENSMDDHQEFNSEAVVQEFNLPEEENLVGVERKRYPFYYHEHHENEWTKRMRAGSVIVPTRKNNACLDTSVLGIPVATHTVLDGCIIVTNSSVYEIRPRISPERLFLHLAMTMPETTPAENLAISIGLDLTSLSELAAEFMLKKSYFGRAMKLFTLSKCPATKRTGGLARHGCISETMIHLRQVLSSPTFELNTSERKFLSNMLLHCFVYQLHSPGQAAANIHAGLSDFLSGSFSFDEQTALSLLADFGEVELLLSLAKARGLVVDALNALVKSQAFTSVPFSALSDLVQRGFSAHLVQSGHGSLLPCLPPEDLVKLLITRPQLAIQNNSVLRPLLAVIQPEQLLELARIFDPSKSVMRGTLLRLQTSRRRTNSLTSLSSYASETTDTTQDQRDMQTEHLLEFFLLVVLHLNHLRRQMAKDPQPPLDFNKVVTSCVPEADNLEKDHNAAETQRKLSVQVQPVSCGPRHSAVIRNGDLYTWGRSLYGRLGHGETAQAVCQPARVETLHILKLRVDAVACGNEHTLALTQQGVYGWGNSKYGQVGVGTRHVYRRPMLLETLQSETTVAVECGHYHSLALTADHQVYTWGWGVHGQLGHCNPEDCLIPTHVRYLLNEGVVKVAGGYAHSLVLTESGSVWSFGCGYFGQLGIGTNNKSSVPQRVTLPSSVPVITIGTKYFHCVAVTSTDRVYMWGLHPHNLRQVASSMRSARHAGVHIPEQNTFLSPSLVDTTYVHGKVTKVCCGSLHSVLVADDGGVYIWGRNLEGQLGTGSRQDERMPKMLTAINDQHIVSVASGGEFNIAFDAEGGLWLWGKNDCGQLGFLKNRRELQHHMRMTSPSTFRRSGNNGQSTEINTPSCMRGLPPSDVTSPHWMSLLASVAHDNLWSHNAEGDSDSDLDNLPQLDKLGDEMYDTCVVPVTLKVLENICETSFCLQKSVDLKDWLTAGHICCMEENVVQALYYRLRAVTDRIGKERQEDIVALCTQLVEHHIKLLLEQGRSLADSTEELQHLCCHALYYWQKHNLPTAHLEAIFSEHLSQLSSWLVEVVLRKPASDSDTDTVSAPFSTHFSLRVIKSAMNSKPAPKRGSKKPGTDWQNMIAKGSVSDDLLQRSIQLQNREKLTPRDRLWADILRNMKKDPGVITLTHSQLDYLDELDQKQRADSQPPSKSYVFTCGHHYSESAFKADALTYLTRELTSGSVKLSNSAGLLKHIVTQPGLKATACPKCIVRGFMAR